MGKQVVLKFSAKKEVEFDVLYRSLVGREVEVLDSRNKNQVGLKGVLVFESANLFFLEVEGGVKKVLKSEVVLKVGYGKGFVRVDGGLFLGSLMNRIKKIK